MCPAPGIYKHQYGSSINAPLFIKHSLLKIPHKVSLWIKYEGESIVS